MKRRGVLREGLDVERELERLETQNPPPFPQGPAPGGGW